MQLNRLSILGSPEFWLSCAPLQRFGRIGALWFSVLCVVFAVSGCREQRYPNIEYPPWAELQQMQSTEIAMPVDTSYAQGDMASFK